MNNIMIIAYIVIGISFLVGLFYGFNKTKIIKLIIKLQNYLQKGCYVVVIIVCFVSLIIASILLYGR